MKYVIACNRPWCEKLHRDLQCEASSSFVFIGKKDELTVETLQMLQPRYVFFPHWSYLIPEDIYTRFECVIFHMTDVPYGRGGSPLQNLIVRGHKDTKITALQCVKELDAGPVYLKENFYLYGNAEEIYVRATAVIKQMILRIIKEMPLPSDQEGETVIFKRRKPDDGDLTQSHDLEEFYDMIRMLDAEGYPHAFVRIGKYKIEFTRASRKTDSILADAKITMEE